MDEVSVVQEPKYQNVPLGITKVFLPSCESEATILMEHPLQNALFVRTPSFAIGVTSCLYIVSLVSQHF